MVDQVLTPKSLDVEVLFVSILHQEVTDHNSEETYEGGVEGRVKNHHLVEVDKRIPNMVRSHYNELDLTFLL